MSATEEKLQPVAGNLYVDFVASVEKIDRFLRRGGATQQPYLEDQKNLLDLISHDPDARVRLADEEHVFEVGCVDADRGLIALKVWHRVKEPENSHEAPVPGL